VASLKLRWKRLACNTQKMPPATDATKKSVTATINRNRLLCFCWTLFSYRFNLRSKAAGHGFSNRSMACTNRFNFSRETSRSRAFSRLWTASLNWISAASCWSHSDNHANASDTWSHRGSLASNSASGSWISHFSRKILPCTASKADNASLSSFTVSCRDSLACFVWLSRFNVSISAAMAPGIATDQGPEISWESASIFSWFFEAL